LPTVPVEDIIRNVKVLQLHRWHVNTEEAFDIQQKLAASVCRMNEVLNPRFIAGVDISAERDDGTATGAVVVLKYPELKLMEAKSVNLKLTFPYVPGLLSFRESPVILAACEKLTIVPDLIIVDGQGIAHPRRMGIASHLGMLLDTPTIGCAKSRLCGTHAPVPDEPGSYTELKDKDELIGVVLRTKAGASPLYVSIGHKVDLMTAIYWVLECCRGYRLPEPTRLAHLVAGGSFLFEAKVSAEGYQKKLFDEE